MIHKALEKTPADRFVTAEKFTEALEMAEQGATPRGVTPAGVTPAGVYYGISGWSELARRRVCQAAASYVVIAWALLQLAEVTFEPLGIPMSVWTGLVWAAIGGFPVAVLLSWLYELTPRGIRRTQAVEATPVTGARMHGRPRIALTLSVMALGAVGVTSYLTTRDRDDPPTPVTVPPLPDDAHPGSIAVIPFRVPEGLEYLSTGIVDPLLRRMNADGVGPDGAAIRRAWREIASADTADVSLDQARLIAREVNSPWLVRGSIVRGANGQLVVSADVVITRTGRTDRRATIVVAEDEILTSLPRLSAQLLSHVTIDLLDDVPFEAIVAFAEGKRRSPNRIVTGNPAAAIPFFERAVAIDSMFGSAHSALFWANRFAGRPAHDGPLVVRAFTKLSEMSERERALLIVNYGWGYSGLNRADPLSRLLLADSIADLHPDWVEAWGTLGYYLYSRGDRYAYPDWQRRAINATDKAAALSANDYKSGHWRSKFRAGIAWPDVWPDSVRVWGELWVNSSFDNPRDELFARWLAGVQFRDSASLGPVLEQFDEHLGAAICPGSGVRQPVGCVILDMSAWYGYPLDLGAEQAVYAATSSAVTQPESWHANRQRARLALLRGQIRDAAALYSDLGTTGDRDLRWEIDVHAALIGLVDPAFRKAAPDLMVPFRTVRDTAPEPRFASGWDNPLDRLCVEDPWSVIVDGDFSRGVKEEARLSTTERFPITLGEGDQTELAQYEATWCDAVTAAYADRAGEPGKTPNPSLEILDAMMRHPNGSNILSRGEVGGLLSARLLIEQERYEPALVILDQHLRGRAAFMPAILFTEGVAAASAGDPERATRAFRRYLTLRSDPDDLARDEVDVACNGLGDVAGQSALEEFPQCR